MAKKPVRKKDGALKDPDRGADEYEDEILSRYLVDKKDNIIGESIGIEGNDVVVKHKNKFYLVPRKCVKLKGKKLVLTRQVDWIGALAKGEGWKREELDPLWGKLTPKAKKKPEAKKKPQKAPVKKPAVKKPAVKKKAPRKKSKEE